MVTYVIVRRDDVGLLLGEQLTDWQRKLLL